MPPGSTRPGLPSPGGTFSQHPCKLVPAARADTASTASTRCLRWGPAHACAVGFVLLRSVNPGFGLLVSVCLLVWPRACACAHVCAVCARTHCQDASLTRPHEHPWALLRPGEPTCCSEGPRLSQIRQTFHPWTSEAGKFRFSGLPASSTPESDPVLCFVPSFSFENSQTTFITGLHAFLEPGWQL